VQLWQVDFRSNLAVSNTGTGSIIPFYLQPTVGGSDINSKVSLRGFPNYRFRDRNAVAVQVEYSVPIADPVGLLLFYDAGQVGSTVSDLTFAHLRQTPASALHSVFRKTSSPRRTWHGCRPWADLEL
jgi:outer membrane protein assembly factor BamA